MRSWAKRMATGRCLQKINFPRKALILSGIYQTLFNGAIKLGILLLVLPFMGVHPGWGGLLIPVGLLGLVLTGTALGLAITPWGCSMAISAAASR